MEKLFDYFGQLKEPSSIEQTRSILVTLSELISPISSHDVSLDMNEILFTNYLELLESEAFEETIAKHAGEQNHAFLRSLANRFRHPFVLEVLRRMKHKVRQQFYFRFFDRLNSSTRILSLLCQTNTNQLHPTVTNASSVVLILGLQFLMDLNVKLNTMDLDKYRTTLLQPMLDLFDRQYHDPTPLTNNILHFFTHTSRQTSLVPLFVQLHYPHRSLQWLIDPHLTWNYYHPIVKSIYRICQHDDGIEAFNTRNHTSILFNLVTNVINTRIEFIFDMTSYQELTKHISLISLLSVENYDSLTDNDKMVLDQYLIKETILTKNGSLDEYLYLWVKLATFDQVLFFHLLQNTHGSERYFFHLLDIFVYGLNQRSDNHEDYLESDVRTILSFVNIYWSLSFHQAFRTVTLNDLPVLRKLTDYCPLELIDRISSNLYLPDRMASYRRALDGIEENLFPSSSLRSVTSSVCCSLMISYSHADMKICRQLVEILTPLSQLSIYVDFQNCKYLWKETVYMIDQADLILVLLSKHYFQSKSCRQEFFFATNRSRRPILPLLLEDQHQPTDWLNKHLSLHKPIRFNPDDLSELLAQINGYFSMAISWKKPTSNIKTWTEEDVKQWFEKHQLRSSLCDFYRFKNGQELLLFAHALSRSPWTAEFDRIRQRLNDASTMSAHDFLKFIHALEKIG